MNRLSHSNRRHSFGVSGAVANQCGKRWASRGKGKEKPRPSLKGNGGEEKSKKGKQGRNIAAKTYHVVNCKRVTISGGAGKVRGNRMPGGDGGGRDQIERETLDMRKKGD